MNIPKNFGFKTIPVETSSRLGTNRPRQTMWEVLKKQAKRDFAEFTKEEKRDAH